MDLKTRLLDKVRSSKSLPLILLTLFLLVYLFPLGARQILIPDETRYGEIPREMIASGDWVVPRLDGLRYFEKPVFGYWAQAVSILIFGENNFALRLPSALAVGLSALLIYLLVLRGGGREGKADHWLATASTLIYLTCFLVAGVGTFALLDGIFSFFLTACITAFYFATQARQGSARQMTLLLLAGVASGLAFLTKGFLGFVLPVLALLPFLLWQKRLGELWRLAWPPLLAAVVVALPWSILIHLREPDFWWRFAWYEHIHRFLADSAQHKRSFWFFFLAAPGIFLPWAFVLPSAAAGIDGRMAGPGRENSLLRLALCWFVLPFLFFSLSKGKLLTYVLPCVPPLAILLSQGLAYTLGRGKVKLFNYGVMILAAFLGLVLLALLYVQIVGFQGFHLYSATWKTLLAAGGLAFFIAMGVGAIRAAGPKRKIVLLALAPLLLLATAPYLLPNLTLEASAPSPLFHLGKHPIRPDAVVIADQEAAAAACWCLGRDDVYVLGSPGELKYGLSYQDARDRRLRLPAAVRLILHHRGNVALIIRSDRADKLLSKMPRPVYLATSGPKGFTLALY